VYFSLYPISRSSGYSLMCIGVLLKCEYCSVYVTLLVLMKCLINGLKVSLMKPQGTQLGIFCDTFRNRNILHTKIKTGRCCKDVKEINEVKQI
jgi:hypothetical protein